MIDHAPAKVDSYDFYSEDICTPKFEWECSCGDALNGFVDFEEAYTSLQEHCKNATNELIKSVAIVAIELYDIAKNAREDFGYDFNALAKHVLVNGYVYNNGE